MIVPGSANPLLMAQSGDPLDELGKIERSIRFRAAAGAVMSRAVTVTGDRKKWKMVIGVKGAGLGTSYCLFDAFLDTQNFTRVYLLSSGAIQFDTSTGNAIVGQAVTSRLMRDPAAHFELGITFDSANATAADRMIIEINGARQSLSSYSAPALNLDSWMNMSGTTLYFGRTGSTALYFDGYLSWPRLTDGQIPAASAYGVSHPRTSQWRTKGKSAIRAAVATGGGARNGWGTNGFFLPLDDVTSLTALCYDRSQSDTDTAGNNLTATNISLTAGVTYDSMLDSPTNNHATLNQLDKTYGTLGSGGIIDGALTAKTGVNSADGLWVKSTISLPAYGEWFWEVRIDNLISIYDPGTRFRIGVNDGYITEADIALAVGDIVGIKFNGATNQLIYFKNGAATGITKTATRSAYNSLHASAIMVGSQGSQYSQLTFNFGQKAFSYPASQGSAKTLCAKNLAFPVVANSDSAIAMKSDTGANIAATLSSAAAWSSWIRMYKRCDAAEGWRWQFSDDPGFFLDSDNTNAKAAFPAMVGTSYLGVALKVGATNGITTGRLNHVNGVADVVVDGQATAKKSILLKNEATGHWFWYHPYLSAGKLLYLNDATTGETTDSTINSVTTSGFSVAGALPTGIYRWVVLGEIDQFLSIVKWTTDGLADGPMAVTPIQPKLFIGRLTSSGDAVILTAERNQRNVANNVLYIDGGDSETVSSAINTADLVSNGVKLRSATSGAEDLNYLSGRVAIGIAIGQPFRYANAR